MPVFECLLALLPLVAAAQAPAQMPPAERQFISVDSRAVALAHVTVIDGTGRAATNDQTIIVQDGKITWVGSRNIRHRNRGAGYATACCFAS